MGQGYGGTIPSVTIDNRFYNFGGGGALDLKAIWWQKSIARKQSSVG